MQNQDSPFSIQARFEGYPIADSGTAQIPNLLIWLYEPLGLTDSHFALIVHVLSRKWTAAAPYPAISKIRMSASEPTRREYVRQLRNKGLLFTRRLYWTNEDLKQYPQAQPGKVRSNEWYFGSLLHNLTRMSQWLEAHMDPKIFTIEIPQITVDMFLKDLFHDTPPHVAQAIKQGTNNGQTPVSVLLSEKPIVEPTIGKATSRKATSRKTDSHEEETESNKNQTNNKKKRPKVDPMTHIFESAQRGVTESTGANPDDQWITYGKAFEQTYKTLTGSNLTEAERIVISRLSGEDDADPKVWEDSIVETFKNWTGNGKPSLERMTEVYLHGRGDYAKFAAWKWPKEPKGKEEKPKDYTPPVSKLGGAGAAQFNMSAYQELLRQQQEQN